MTPEALERRNAAIRAAWEDPLKRALQSRRARERLGLDDQAFTKRDDPNAYMRNYLPNWRRRKRFQARHPGEPVRS